MTETVQTPAKRKYTMSEAGKEALRQNAAKARAARAAKIAARGPSTPKVKPAKVHSEEELKLTQEKRCAALAKAREVRAAKRAAVVAAIEEAEAAE